MKRYQECYTLAPQLRVQSEAQSRQVSPNHDTNSARLPCRGFLTAFGHRVLFDQQHRADDGSAKRYAIILPHQKVTFLYNFKRNSGRYPDCVLVGAKKCGTGFLNILLRQNPSVAMAKGEVHFFDKHLDEV